MRLSQISPVNFHAVSQRNIPTTQAIWQSQNSRLQGIVIVTNHISHAANNNKYVTERQAENAEVNYITDVREGTLAYGDWKVAA